MNINAFVESQLKTSLKPWSHYFLQYNPAITNPSIVIKGS